MRSTRVIALLTILFALGSPASSAVLDAFIKIPGLPGASSDLKHVGWWDIESDQLLLAPPVAEKGKAVTSQCSATFEIILREHAAAAVELVGSPLADQVVVEVVDQLSGVLSRASLGGVAIASIESSFPSLGYKIRLTFSQLELTTREQKPDGSLGATHIGHFDCAVQK